MSSIRERLLGGLKPVLTPIVRGRRGCGNLMACVAE